MKKRNRIGAMVAGAALVAPIAGLAAASSDNDVEAVEIAGETVKIGKAPKLSFALTATRS